MLISKKQHWRPPAKELEEERTRRLHDWQEKIPGKEKIKLILIAKLMVEKNDTFCKLKNVLYFGK